MGEGRWKNGELSDELISALIFERQAMERLGYFENICFGMIP